MRQKPCGHPLHLNQASYHRSATSRRRCVELQQSVTDLAERLQTIRTNYPERQERVQYMEELYLRTIMKIAQNKDVKIYWFQKVMEEANASCVC